MFTNTEPTAALWHQTHQTYKQHRDTMSHTLLLESTFIIKQEKGVVEMHDYLKKFGFKFPTHSSVFWLFGMCGMSAVN